MEERVRRGHTGIAGAGLAARLTGALLRGRERYLLRVVVQGALEAEEHQQEQRGHQEDHLDGHRPALVPAAAVEAGEHGGLLDLGGLAGHEELDGRDDDADDDDHGAGPQDLLDRDGAALVALPGDAVLEGGERGQRRHLEGDEGLQHRGSSFLVVRLAVWVTLVLWGRC